MCGLAAIIPAQPTTDAAAIVSGMLDRIAHRGPDDRQILALGRDLSPARGDQPAAIVLGFHRLAILDLTDAGRQPMRDPSGRFTVILNGEIYNYLELGAELARQGVQLKSRSDTEVLLHLYARHGEACLPMLDGMFAFVIVDAQRRTVLAARDRFGIKPLYRWTAPDGSILLASEIKAFTAHPQWKARLDGQRAWDYLARGLIDHTDRTLFDGVRAVPAGHLMRINLDQPAREPAIDRWYELRPAADVGSPGDWPRRFGELLQQSVQRHLRSDVTVGSCLSGGLDSSAIVCLAAEALRAQDLPFTQKTFTARSQETKLDEWPHAQAVASMTGAQAIEVWTNPADLIPGLGHWVWVQDEPLSSPSMVMQHEVFAAARAHGVTVMLDGQGADEQLAGYHSFFKVRLLELAKRGHWIAALQTAGDIRKMHRLDRATLLGQALAAGAPTSVLRLAASRRLVHHVIDARQMGAQESDPFDALDGRRRGVRAYSIDLLQAASLPMLLHWEDRNSMAHGVEARVPFLQHELVEFVLGLPPEAKLNGGLTKCVLREAMNGRMPESVRMRMDKIAFAAPERQWLCGEHRAATAEALKAALNLCGSMMRPAGAARLRAMVEGREPYDGLLWRVICLGAWLRRFDVRSG